VGSPLKYVWTYAAGKSDDYDWSGYSYCPCAVYPGPPPPASVENEYYCESGDVGGHSETLFYLSDGMVMAALVVMVVVLK